MGGTGRPASCAQPAHLHQVDEALHVLLHLVQAAQARPARPSAPPATGSGSVLRFRRSPSGPARPAAAVGLVRGLAGAHRRAVRPAGDEVLHIQRGLAAGHPRLVAEGGHGVGAGIDEGGLVLADQPVGGGKEQHHQGEGVHEPAAQALALLHVRLHQPPEEIGQHKAGVV